MNLYFFNHIQYVYVLIPTHASGAHMLGPGFFNHVKEHMSRSSAGISYIDATLEIASQLDTINVDQVKIYIASGGGLGGLQIGAAALGLPWEILGVLIGTPEESFADVVGW